jgi:hypothetical protein
VLQIVAKLVLELFPPDTFAASAISEGVPSLDHEFRDDAVEDHAFEVSASGVTDEVLDSQRRLLQEQPNVDVPKCCVDRSLVGKRRRACALRGRGRHDCLFLSCGVLVEDVPVMTRFVPGGRSIR